MAELISFDRTLAVLKDYALAAQDLYKDKLLWSGRVATGGLIDSVRTEVAGPDGRRISVLLHVSEVWKWVEWDTKPHWPPPGALLNWIEAKPVIPYPDARGRIPTPRQLDFLIRRKIGREGTKGSHDLQHTLQELNAAYNEKIAQAVAEDFSAAADVILRVFAR